MYDPRDIIPMGTGFVTAGMGGLTLTLSDVQTIMGIIATGVGIILTIATFIWRCKEHKKRMNDSDRNDREGTL